ncbi:MAG: hypothetical protein JSV72_22685 [Ralstonia sp.]|nr:MAG: hypothetical protein JSV72_22685 [Ralstonia sp.]
MSTRSASAEAMPGAARSVAMALSSVADASPEAARTTQ